MGVAWPFKKCFKSNASDYFVAQSSINMFTSHMLFGLWKLGLCGDNVRFDTFLIKKLGNVKNI